MYVLRRRLRVFRYQWMRGRQRRLCRGVREHGRELLLRLRRGWESPVIRREILRRYVRCSLTNHFPRLRVHFAPSLLSPSTMIERRTAVYSVSCKIRLHFPSAPPTSLILSVYPLSIFYPSPSNAWIFYFISDSSRLVTALSAKIRSELSRVILKLSSKWASISNLSVRTGAPLSPIDTCNSYFMYGVRTLALDVQKCCAWRGRHNAASMRRILLWARAHIDYRTGVREGLWAIRECWIRVRGRCWHKSDVYLYT